MRNINGTLIGSYYICKREVWYMAHELLPDQDNTFLELGRIIENNFYERDEKGIIIEGLKIDLIKKKEGNLVIGEIKKSIRSEKSGIMQLYFYLMYLKERGIEATGEVLFPNEKRKVKIKLTEEIEMDLKKAIEEIEEIIKRDIPPRKEKIKYCTNCAYREFCWS